MTEEDYGIGVFLGLSSSAYEYIASIIAPYQQRYAPKVGGFLLIDNVTEYLVARVMDYIPKGELTTFMGEKWLSEVALSPNAIGQDLKRKKVSYRVKIKLLGRLHKTTQTFTPGLSQIPHITSRVIQPGPALTRVICRQVLPDQESGIHIGDYWLDRNIDVHFDVRELVGKRTFIFARAGYGKSNLMKVLAANWRSEHGSLMIFDPEGEYSITDNKGRPGIMDQIPAVLVTNRIKVRDALAGANVYSRLKFNLKDFRPGFIVPILVTEAKHETVFFAKLMSLKEAQWHKLVDIIYKDGWGASSTAISIVLKEGKVDEYEQEDISVQPIINNLVHPIKKLHDPDSQLLRILEQAAHKGLPVILDISLLDSKTALQFSSIIVSYFFGQNQAKFTGGQENLYKIVFVVEEAQSVIGGRTNVSRFVELAKEGRKYDLGGIFITQQPASIAPEILSQGDNFFVFHMLNKGDLKALEGANAHYSSDIVTQILNEPIPGKGYMWMSRQPFVLPIQVTNFEGLAHPNRAAELQQDNPLLPDLRIQVSSLEAAYKSILIKFKEVAQAHGVGSNEDAKFHGQDGLKGDISKALYRELTDKQREFLTGEDAIQDFNGRPFAIKYHYIDKLWDDQKGLPPLSMEPK